MNRLFALPTDSTLEMLQTVFAGSMIPIDWDSLSVELASSQELIEPTEGEYRAITGALGVWYDDATGMSHLLLPLIPSPEMVQRHRAIGDAWGREFVPFMAIAPDPILRRARRSFINSVSTRFVDFPLMLTFHNELVVSDNSVVPNQQNFYQDFMSRGEIPEKLFVDISNSDA